MRPLRHALMPPLRRRHVDFIAARFATILLLRRCLPLMMLPILLPRRCRQFFRRHFSLRHFDDADIIATIRSMLR